MKITVGDKVRKRITFGKCVGKNVDDPAYTGTVIWVHPQDRFYVAEFPFRNGKIRECYMEGCYGKKA